MLAWVLNLGFGGSGVELTEGPYFVAAVDQFSAGAVATEQFAAGAVATEQFAAGAVAHDQEPDC